MTTVPATDASSLSDSVVFAIGFHASERLVEEYRGRVVFQNAPESVQTPAHIPVGTTLILMCNKAFYPHKSRIGTQLSKAVPNCIYEELSGLVALNDRLRQLFAEKISGGPTPTRLHAVPSAHNSQSDSTDDKTDNLDSEKILAVTCRPGSQSEWVRDNMNFPCNYRTEARRLLPLAVEKFATASENGIYQAIYNIVSRAKLGNKVLSEPGSPRPKLGAVHSAPTLAPDPTLVPSEPRAQTPVSKTGVGLHDLVQGLQQQLATFVSEFAVSVKVVSDLYAGSEEKRAELQARVDALQTQVDQLTPDAEAYRAIAAGILRNRPR